MDFLYWNGRVNKKMLDDVLNCCEAAMVRMNEFEKI